MTKNKQKRLMLLDGNAIIHRAFHAIPPLTTQAGLQVNAVYGFASTFLNVLEKFQPDYVIASFDVSKKTFRNEKYADYKANRKATPDDLIHQFSLTKDLVKDFNIPVVEKEGFEADDVIGTLAKQASEQGLEVIIVTGDKDTLQLVDENIKVFTMSRGIKDMVLYDREMVIEKMGIAPEQIIDYKGLRGDSSDNIPGVKGVGEKTALDLLHEYETLDNIYSNLENIKESVKKKLETDKEKAYLSRELGTIVLDVPVKLELKKADVSEISFTGARKSFQKFEFKTLIKRLPDNGEEVETENQNEVIILDSSNADKFFEQWVATHCLVSIFPDFENEVFYGLGMAIGDEIFYLSFNEKNKDLFSDFLLNEKIKKISFDIKNLLHILDKYDLELKGVETDVLLEAYVLRTGKKIVLDDLIFEVTGRVVDPEKKSNQMMMNLRDEKMVQKESCQKAQDILRIHDSLAREIDSIAKDQDKKNNVKTLLEKLEMPLVQVLFNMEKNGVAFDAEIFEKISKDFNKKIGKLEKDIYEMAGEEFNINSTKQLRVVLFDKLKIDTTDIKKTKTGFSTASSELEKIKAMHPIAKKIEEYRELFKLKTTYIDALPKLIDENNRIHTTFNQAVTATGRLSSSDPNLQNIPIRTETGRRLRKGFVAEKGYKLVSADYSQIDLRCIAHVSQDKNLIEAFKNDLDIHSFTAAKVRGKDISEIDKEERRSAKELNFGLIYGMGSFGFSRAADITVNEAKEFIKKYFEKFPDVKKYIDQTKKEVEENGFVETEMGRRRNVPEIYSKNFQLKAMGERMAVNMPIQGLSADIMKLAMIAVFEYLKKNFENDEARMILQIHDEIILEVKDNLVKKVSEEIKKIMEGVYKFSVPLVVDVAVGGDWSEL